MTMLSDDDIALAAEYVLGLLDAAGEAQANARIATDTGFAAEVEAWRIRLQPILDREEAPPAYIWQKLALSLPPESGQDVEKGNIRLWQMIAGVSSTAAAVLGILLLQQPAPVPQAAPPVPMVAALGSDTGNASLTASYDAKSGKMLLTPVAMDTGKLFPELWIIPADGEARSLGIVRGDVPSEITVNPQMRVHIAKGAMLAITPEPEGGAPGGKATGPVIASGKITTI